MSDSVTRPVFTANAGVQAGYKTYGTDEVLILGPKGGVKVEHKGFHAGAEVGIGTALTANVEVGKEFDINKNFGLDLSANAGTAVNLSGKSQSTIIHNYVVNGQQESLSSSASWKSGVTTAGVKVMANYTTNNGKFEFGAGLSGQYVTNHAKNVSLTSQRQTSENIVEEKFSTINAHAQGVVVSPELSASYKANEHLTFNANGNFLGGGVTATWTF